MLTHSEALSLFPEPWQAQPLSVLGVWGNDICSLIWQPGAWSLKETHLICPRPVEAVEEAKARPLEGGVHVWGTACSNDLLCHCRSGVQL